MSTSCDRLLPAWVVSVVTHSLIVTVALVVVERRPRGAADQPVRDAGIVLRREDSSQTRYEGDPAEQSQQPELTNPTPTPQDLAAALPDAATADLSQYLPSATAPLEVKSLGPAASAAGGGNGRTLPGALAAGGAATVGVFGVQGTGHKFVYAFDRSVSMTGAPLTAAKRELLESLDSLGSTHQFQILFFNHRLRAFDLTSGAGRTAFASDKTREAARRFVDLITADGGTDRYQALRRALAMEPDVIFFLTDADDAMTAVELRQIAQQNEKVGATISTIEFGRGPSQGKENFLRQLARLTGGQFGYVDTTRLVEE